MPDGRDVVRRRPVARAGAGIAGLAAALTLTPAAHAAPSAPPTTPSGTAPGPTAPSPGDTRRTARPAVQPDYGKQKFRVGVRVQDGSVVPPGTTTVGSELSIVATHQDGTSAPAFGCTTDRADPPDSTSFCTAADNPFSGAYTAQAGDTITITQTGVEPGLIADPLTRTVQPCLAGQQQQRVQADADFCLDPDGSFKTTDVVFEDTSAVPQAQADAVATDAGSSVTIPVLANDSTHGQPITGLAVTTPPGHGTATASTGVSPTVTYVPTAGFIGTDSFSYTVTTASGSASATVTVRVGAVPTAGDDAVSTDIGHPVSAAVTANDDLHGEPGFISVSGGPVHGTATVDGTTVRYTPAAGYAGTDHLTYTVTTSSGTASATLTVTVRALPPIAVADSATTPRGKAVTIAVLGNDDSRGGGSLTLDGVTAPGHGSVRVAGSSVVYTPAAGFVGRDSFSYAVGNAAGDAHATVEVTVTAPPSPAPPRPTPPNPPGSGGTSGSGGTPPVPPTLPNTGTDAREQTAWGVGLVVLGAVAMLGGRRRRRLG